MKFRSYHRTCALILSAIIALSSSASAQKKSSIDQVNWSQFLSNQDMVWNKLPKQWKESPFLGNGEQGTMIYQTDPNTLRWTVGCSAAHDHRPLEDDDFSEKNVTVLNRGRHFIGHLELKSPQKLTSGKAHLDLWNAEATGTLNASSGKAEWTSIVHANEPIIYAEVAASGSLKDVEFTYIPALAQNPRAIRGKNPRSPANPPAVITKSPDGVQLAVQNLHSGGQTAVAWKQTKTAGKLKIWLCVKHSFPGKEASAQAQQAVRTASKADQKKWQAAHRSWWHNYYPQSFISTGDAYWDAFYWAQQYKLACATRDKGWIIDNQGPWLQPTAWNALWWNLNVQIAHSGFPTANRRAMGSALSNKFDLLRDNLALNVAKEFQHDSYAIGRNTSGWDLLGYAGQPGTGRPPMDKNIATECGNFLWALHNIDLEYRYWQDTELRDKVLYPLLIKGVNYYRHFLKEEKDGLLHLPKTYSPEYRSAEDCSYDIDVLRWANNRLLELAAEKNLTKSQEPLITKWLEIKQKLVPTHSDETGFMVGKNVPLTGMHRHWSHLLSIYPLRTITPENEADRALILRSLDHWHGFKKGGLGYSVTGGSCMASLLGDGDRAYTFLNRLKSFLTPNTFYVELGTLPVIETPLHGATAIQEMLLQSWNGRLRIFPAVPKAWPNATFHQLRGEGAYLVSASRKNSKTQWALIQPQAKAGGSVEIDAQIPNAQWTATPGITVDSLGKGIYKITTAPTAKDPKVMFWPKGTNRPKLEITPPPIQTPSKPFGKP
ncbi:MAG: glycosyl hydrolase family 95 catalytic domain-containing protein [Akkermansiaceae bacterium]